MRKFSRVFWLLTLCIFVSGCATYRRVDFPDTVSDVNSSDQIVAVSNGVNVRITLFSGDVVSGKIIWVTDDELALGNSRNYGYEDRVVKVGEIDFVEVRDQSDGQIEGRWFLGLGAAALISIYIGLHNIEMN